LTDKPHRDEPTLLDELQAGLAEEQQLIAELGDALRLLRKAAEVSPAELDCDQMWAEVQRRLLAATGGEGERGESSDPGDRG
jgi:hypothetical protein